MVLGDILPSVCQRQQTHTPLSTRLAFTVRPQPRTATPTRHCQVIHSYPRNPLTDSDIFAIMVIDKSREIKPCQKCNKYENIRFIGQCARGQRTKAGSCASVYFEPANSYKTATVYSYGRHYPLLVNIAGKWILNDRGYSNTTAKHINYARDYADYAMAMGSEMNRDSTPANLLKEAETERAEQAETLAKLSPRATRQASNATERIATLDKTIAFLKSVK